MDAQLEVIARFPEGTAKISNVVDFEEEAQQA
jgi:hypothetical protein